LTQKVHGLIVSHLKSEMPSVFGKSSKQANLIENLDVEFLKVQKLHRIALGDFPDLDKFRAALRAVSLNEFPKLNPKLMTALDEVLSVDLPRLMQMFPQGNPSLPDHLRNPFADFIATTPDGVAIDPVLADPWSWESVERSRYIERFRELTPTDGKVSGAMAKPILMESELPVADLGQIWGMPLLTRQFDDDTLGLADLTKDGYLDVDEFTLAMHLIKVRKAGVELPKMLPDTLIPPKGKV
jgi:EH domain-containing protein 3/EH domain-containing protein 1